MCSGSPKWSNLRPLLLFNTIHFMFPYFPSDCFKTRGLRMLGYFITFNIWINLSMSAAMSIKFTQKSNIISGSCEQPLNTKQAIRSGPPQDITDSWIDLCVGVGYIKWLKKSQCSFEIFNRQHRIIIMMCTEIDILWQLPYTALIFAILASRGS